LKSILSDDLECYHWIKAEQQGFDYPYAKFNKKTEAIMYTDSEYESFLQTSRWTRSETDYLMFLCFEYDLRWPVIADRYEPTSPRTTEELMARYYYVLSKLKANRAEQGDFSTRNMPYTSFNVEYERARRKQQDLLFHRCNHILCLFLLSIYGVFSTEFLVCCVAGPRSKTLRRRRSGRKSSPSTPP
jgi:DNA methyltransferase 1-associated protein 1